MKLTITDIPTFTFSSETERQNRIAILEKELDTDTTWIDLLLLCDNTLNWEKFEGLEAVVFAMKKYQIEDPKITLLHVAARFNQSWLVSKILEKGLFDIWAANGEGKTPYDVAVESNIHGRFSAVARQLSPLMIHDLTNLACERSKSSRMKLIGIEKLSFYPKSPKKISPELFYNLAEQAIHSSISSMNIGKGNDVLMYFWLEAATFGKIKIMQWLHHVKGVGIDVAVGGNSVKFYNAIQEWDAKYSALSLACANGDHEIAQWLHANGASIQKKGGNYEDTPLSLAIKNKQFKIVVWLCNDTSIQKEAILMASKCGNLEALQLLHANGFCMDVSDDLGDTPLLLAVKSGHLEIVKWWLDYGVDVDKGNNDNVTALEVALAHGRSDVTKALQAYIMKNNPPKNYAGDIVRIPPFTLELEDVRHLIVRPDGRIAYLTNNYVIVWDVMTGKIRKDNSYSKKTSLAVLQNGDLICGDKYSITILDFFKYASTSSGSVNSFWRCQSGEYSDIEHLTVLADGRFVGVHNKKIKIWQGDHKIWKGGHDEIFCSEDAPGNIACLKVLRDGRLAISYKNGVIQIWDVVKRTCDVVLKVRTASLSAFTELDDGRLAIGDNIGITIWDVQTQQCVEILLGHTGNITCLIVLPGGNFASGSSDTTIKIWDIQKLQCIATIRGHKTYVKSLAVLLDGKLVSVSGNTIKIWEFPALNQKLLPAKPSYLETKTAKQYVNEGNVFYEQGNYQKALASYNEAIRLNPELAEAHNGKSTVLRLLGQHQEALLSYNKALSLNSKLAEAHNGKGWVLYALGLHQEALVSFNEALRLNPKLAEAHNGKSTVLGILGQDQEALASLNEELSLNPNLAEIHIQKGHTLCKLGQHQEAFLSYNKALNLDPKLAEAHNGKGTVLRLLGQHQEALLSYNKALSLNPKLAEAHNGKGTLLHLLGQHQEALLSYNEVLKLDPNDADSHNNKGYVLLFLGQLDNALACYEKAFELAKKEKTIQIMGLIGKGNILLQLNRYREALENFTLALSLNPSEHVIVRCKEYKKINPAFLSPADGRNVCHAKLSSPFSSSKLSSSGKLSAMKLADIQHVEFSAGDSIDIDSLRADLEREERIRDDGDTHSVMSLDSEVTTASEQFYSTDPEEIAEKLHSRIQRQMRGTRAEVNLGNMKSIMTIQLNTATSASLKNEALRKTLLILLPENSYVIDGSIITLPWNVLKDDHVRRFRKEFLEQENRLLYLQQKEMKATKQNVAGLASQIVDLKSTVIGGFKATQEASEKQQASLDVVTTILMPSPSSPSM